MTREEAMGYLFGLYIVAHDGNEYEHGLNKALDMAIEALQADVVSREEAIQAVDKCRERKNKEIEQLREFYSQKPTIPMFKESEEAYKAWTGEEMGGDGDEINEMNRKIIKDILKTIPTAYLLEALGVATFEELMESADRPHGEWIPHATSVGDKKYIEYSRCSECGEMALARMNFCPNCGADMRGKEE